MDRELQRIGGGNWQHIQLEGKIASFVVEGIARWEKETRHSTTDKLRVKDVILAKAVAFVPLIMTPISFVNLGKVGQVRKQSVPPHRIERGDKGYGQSRIRT